MGTIVTLLEIVRNLDMLDCESTIYAARPWTENSKAMVMLEPESGQLPPDVQGQGLQYFLEVSIAQDFVKDLMAQHFVSMNQICARLIEYAIHDA